MLPELLPDEELLPDDELPPDEELLFPDGVAIDALFPEEPPPHAAGSVRAAVASAVQDK